MKVVHAMKNLIMRVHPIRLGRIYKIMLLSETEIFLFKTKIPFIFKDRHDLYEYIQKAFINNKAIDFLEFGVYKGESLNYWAKMNTNPDSRFFGFDSFLGLPEKWIKPLGSLPSGQFSLDGQIPNIEDNRVNLVKGWFQDTLQDFLRNYECDNKLKVLHFDADLYSSTLFALTKLDSHLANGDIIIFDEFSGGDEFKAFLDYTQAYMKKFDIVAASGPTYQQVAFVYIE
ncbi:MAG TPA: TylF/MycF/NovP-related O-methyltransferase [Methanothrix sp.]|nr:TylF/MycF/NovP-related O-methyltransferase [Methanothrix sp.]